MTDTLFYRCFDRLQEFITDISTFLGASFKLHFLKKRRETERERETLLVFIKKGEELDFSRGKPVDSRTSNNVA